MAEIETRTELAPNAAASVSGELELGFEHIGAS